MPEKMDQLIRLGFRKVGEWRLNGINLLCELGEKDQRGNFIYGFVIGEKIKFLEYSRLPLEARMDAFKHTDHRYATTFQPVNRRVRDKIIASLEDGSPVEIWAFHPAEETLFQGYRVDLAAGVYDSLVKAFAPDWNGYLQ
jgi:hypothetical protein